MANSQCQDVSFFRTLAGNIPAGHEDTFTALLASTISVIPGLDRSVLSWLPLPQSAVDPHAEVSFRAQVHRTHAGESIILDMVAQVGAVEIWWEHKLSSPEQKGADDKPPQVTRYCAIAQQYAERGVGRIFLVLCTRDRAEVVGRADLPGPDGDPVAVLNPSPAGTALRWFDLYDRFRDFQQANEQQLDAQQRWVLAEFLDYWGSLPGMWLARTAGDWDPAASKRTADTGAWWTHVWSSSKTLVAGMLKGNAMGEQYGTGFYVTDAAHPTVKQARVCRRLASDFPLMAARPGEVLCCEYAVSPTSAVRLRQKAKNGPVPGICTGVPRTKVDGNDVIQFVVPISGWAANLSREEAAERLLQPIEHLTRWVMEVTDGAP